MYLDTLKIFIDIIDEYVVTVIRNKNAITVNKFCINKFDRSKNVSTFGVYTNNIIDTALIISVGNKSSVNGPNLSISKSSTQKVNRYEIIDIIKKACNRFNEPEKSEYEMIVVRIIESNKTLNFFILNYSNSGASIYSKPRCS